MSALPKPISAVPISDPTAEQPVADVAVLFPGPGPNRPEHTDWVEFARFPNFWEGQILGGLLENEGLPVIVELTSPGVDLTSRSVVYVPAELAHRARWIVSWPAPSEPELSFLATGELPAPGETS